MLVAGQIRFDSFKSVPNGPEHTQHIQHSEEHGTQVKALFQYKSQQTIQ